MSGQQPPPYGQPPQGPPPYGGPPQGMPPRPPQGPPQGPYGPPPQGPPPGWQRPPEQPGSRTGKSRRGGAVAIAGLSALVVLLAALSAYLWFFDDTGSGGATNASTAAVSLPDEVGDYTVQKEDDAFDIDVEATRENYEEVVGAGYDIKTYVPTDTDSADDQRTITVRAVRADVALLPGYTSKTSSTEIVRDDMICDLIYYEGYDENASAEDAENDDKEQLPQSCSRSDDGLTVYVSTYSTEVDEHAPTVDEMVALTDEAYDAVE